MSPLLTGFPFTAGSAGTPKATVTGTTGSPTVDTSSRAGKTIYKFTGSGTITVGVGGTCEYLVIGGGHVNGAGGYIYNTSGVLPAGTLTVTIGAGTGPLVTAGIKTGNGTRLGDITALPGGITDFSDSGGTYKVLGASSGGTKITSTTNAAMLSGAQGNAGGSGTTGMMGAPATGGGGGAGGAGGNSSGLSSGGTGGAGATNSITGTSTTYSAGAGGTNSSGVAASPAGNGAANTGNGGSNDGSAGGSGFVVVVIG